MLSYIVTIDKNVIYMNSALLFYKKDLEDLKNKISAIVYYNDIVIGKIFLNINYIYKFVFDAIH